VNVITSFSAKRREKEMKYEKKLLKDLSLNMLKKSVQQNFYKWRIQGGFLMEEGFEEACFDVAIEAFLLGGKFSKFGFHGGTYEEAKVRCQSDIYYLTETLYNFILYWEKIGLSSNIDESIYYACEQYIHYWWSEGYNKGIRRYKLRLH